MRGSIVRRSCLLLCLMALIGPLFPLVAPTPVAAQGSTLFPDDVLPGRARPTAAVPPWTPAPIAVPRLVPVEDLVPDEGRDALQVLSPDSELGPEVMQTVSCLAGNGRVDTNIVNPGSAAAAYRIEFEGLTARQRTVNAGDWWRMPITGRPDKDFRVIVKRDGQVVSDRILTVSCDTAPPVITEAEVRVVNSCRAGNGYLLFQFSNPTASSRGYVIEFEGVNNRSTSAAAYGQSVRAVTGRQDGDYQVIVRAAGVPIDTRTISVRCDAQLRQRGFSDGAVSFAGPTSLFVAENGTFTVQVEANGVQAPVYWTEERYDADRDEYCNSAGFTPPPGIPNSTTHNWTPTAQDLGAWVICAFEPTANQGVFKVGGLGVRVLEVEDLGILGYDDDAHLVNMVNPQTGNWVIPRTDVELASVGLPLRIHRVYNSRSKRVGPFGMGWTSDVTQELKLFEGEYRLTQPDGRVDIFTADPIDGPDNDSSTFWGPGRFGSKLEVSQPGGNERRTITYRDGSTKQFTQTATGLFGPSVFTDRSGNTTVFGYDQVGGVFRPTSISDSASGRDLQIGWSKMPARSRFGPSAWLITSVRVDSPQRTGETVEFNYEYARVGDTPVLLRACSPVGGASGSPTCESYGYITPEGESFPCNPGGVQICAVYDAEGRLVQNVSYNNSVVTETFLHPDENTSNRTRYRVQPDQLTAVVTDALGHIWSWDYESAFGRVTAENGPGSAGNRKRTEYGYDADGNVDTITTILTAVGQRGERSVTHIDYDDFGNVTATRREVGGTRTERLVTRYYYEPLGLSAPNAQRLRFVCSGTDASHPTQTLPNGTVGRARPDGTETELPRPEQRKYCKEYQYTNASLPASPTEIRTPIDDNTTASESLTYFLNGKLQQIEAATGLVTRYEYDSSWNLDTIIEPTGRVIELQYNAWGQLRIAREVIDGVTTDLQKTGYDEAGRRIAVIGPDTEAQVGTRFVYDAQGRVQWTVEAELAEASNLFFMTRREIGALPAEVARRSEFRYDRLGRQTEQIFPDNTRTLTRFDPVGNLVETTVGDTSHLGPQADSARVHRYDYDASRRLVTECFDPAAGSTRCTRNVTARYGYDLGDRLTSETAYSDSGVVRKTTRTDYDNADRVKEITLEHPSGRQERVTSYTYDEFGRTEVMEEGDANPLINPTGVRTTRYGHADVWGDRVTSTEVDVADTSNTLRTQTETTDYDVSGLVSSQTVERSPAVTANGAFLIRTTIDRAYNQPLTAARGLGGGRGTIVTTTVGSATSEEAFDERGLLTYSIDPMGNRTDFVHDGARQLIESVRPNVRATTPGGAFVTPITETSYNAFGDIVSVTETTTNDVAGGRGTTTYEHDPVGRMTQRVAPAWTDPITGQTLTPTESWSYDSVGNATSQTNARGYTKTFEYDDLGFLDKERLPARGTDGASWGTFDYDYDWSGSLTRENPPDTAAVSYAHDGFGRVTTTSTVADGIVHQDWIRYDSFGNNVATVSKAGAGTLGGDLVTYAEYNVLGEMLLAGDPFTPGSAINNRGDLDRVGLDIALGIPVPGDTEQIGYDYNHLGQVVRETNQKFGWYSETAYGNRGQRLTTTRLSPGGSFLWADDPRFDLNDNLLSYRSPAGRTTTWEYDALDRVIEVNTPNDSNDPNNSQRAITEYGYNAAGDLTAIKDAEGNTTSIGYNPWGLRTVMVEPRTDQHAATASRQFRWGYDAGGLMTHRVQPARTTLSDYDELGRLISQGSLRDGATQKLIGRVFRYDHATLPVSELSVPGGSQTMEYDERGRPDISSYTHINAATDFAYDSHDRLVSRNDPSASSAHNFTWHADGRLKTHEDPVSGQTTTYSWEEISRPGQASGSITDQMTRGSTSHTMSYETDTGRLESEQILSGIVQRYRADYGNYDRDGNLGSVTIEVQGRSTQTHDYTYDNANRLKTWTSRVGNGAARQTTYGYDANNNRISASGPDGNKTWEYNERNQLLSGPEGTYTWNARGTLSSTSTQEGITTYAFDSLDQLVSVSRPGQALANYSYDALERIADSSNTFVYAGFDTDPVIAANEHYGRTPGGTAVSVNPNGGSTSDAGVLVQNFRGDTTMVIDPNNAFVDYAVTFDPWGKPFEPNGSPVSDTNKPNLGYQSDWTDPATGDIKTDTRWYAPGAAAFRSRDIYAGNPTKPVTQNRYLYANANPIAYTDPTGLNGLSGLLGTYEEELTEEQAVAVQQVVQQVGSTPLPVTETFVYEPGQKIVGHPLTGSGSNATIGHPLHGAGSNAATGTIAAHLVDEAGEQSPSGVEFNLGDFSDGFLDAAGDSAEGLKTTTVAVGSCALKNYTFFLGSCEQLIQIGEDGLELGTTIAAGIAAGNVELVLKTLDGLLPEKCRVQGFDRSNIDYCSGQASFALLMMAAGGGAAQASRLTATLKQFTKKLPGCGNSFSGDTQVLMADGAYVAFVDLALGDEVFAHDPETGEEGAREVVAIWPHIDDVYDIAVADGTVVATENHPFWNATDATWEGLIEFDSGDQVLTVDGQLEDVGEIDFASVQTTTAWDITVEGLHTFFIQVGDTDVLVHNSTCGVGGAPSGTGQQFRGARGDAAPDFTPRPSEFKVDPATGAVRPTHGVSVFDNADSVTSKGFTPHEVDLSSLPPELRVIQRGENRAHFEIVPELGPIGRPLSPAEYADLLCQIECF